LIPTSFNRILPLKILTPGAIFLGFRFDTHLRGFILLTRNIFMIC
jgi:hypothetical protein